MARSEADSPLASAGAGSYGTGSILENDSGVFFLGVLRQAPPLAVRLTESEIVASKLHDTHETWTYPLKDVAGIEIRDAKDRAPALLLVLHTYPKQAGQCCGPKAGARRHVERVLQVDCAKEASTRRVASLWHAALSRLLRGMRPLGDEASPPAAEGGPVPPLPPPPRLLVFINPVSGPGHARRLYARRVAPVLAHAGCEVVEHVTEYPTHATEACRGLDVRAWDAVVIVGGDGLMHEVLEGFMQRPDWAEAMRLPFGIIPGGSGNGLAASILHACHEVYDVTTSAFMVARGISTPLDVCTVATAKGITHSFLSVTWGLTADADIESERYRCLGSARFTIGGAVRIVRLRHYEGRLAYLPADGERAAEAVPDYWTTHASALRDKEEEEEQGSSGSGDAPEGVAGADEERASLSKPECTLLPAFEDDLPEGWVVDEGDFVLLWACNTSHASWDLHATPTCELADGLVHLLALRRGQASKARMVAMMMAMETGGHTEFPEVEIVPTRAFRLDPGTTARGRKSMLVVDGEVLDEHSRLQCEVHRGLARVLCLPGGGATQLLIDTGENAV